MKTESSRLQLLAKLAGGCLNLTEEIISNIITSQFKMRYPKRSYSSCTEIVIINLINGIGYIVEFKLSRLSCNKDKLNSNLEDYHCINN